MAKKNSSKAINNSLVPQQPSQTQQLSRGDYKKVFDAGFTGAPADDNDLRLFVGWAIVHINRSQDTDEISRGVAWSAWLRDNTPHKDYAAQIFIASVNRMRDLLHDATKIGVELHKFMPYEAVAGFWDLVK